MYTLTVFTPTYNRAHTLDRTYKSLCRQTCKDFCWLVVDDGSTDNTHQLVDGWIADGVIPIRYIYKENGGLYTGYNTAYANIDTELNVCIDSDDYMPDDAVEIIIDEWKKHGSDNYAGLLGLDFNHKTGLPIGGFFPECLKECYFLHLYIKRIHVGDSKPVLRTDLMKRVAPQIGFPGEKSFNPVYMMLQVCDDYPILLLNHNLCYVEYQEVDSMSKSIYNQYFESPRSFSKSRLLEMKLKRSTFFNKIRVTIHYIATSIISRNKNFICESNQKFLTVLLIPFGIALYFFLKYKVKR